MIDSVHIDGEIGLGKVGGAALQKVFFNLDAWNALDYAFRTTLN